ncbi:Streptococcus pyogenes, putative [Babesia ovis]|uniref:Streptococcus pyogenes, putative n=1 Tax=Babesia ovis TaxID=5869 RepID=A0A9W5WWL5_BABOV|nr:Streptococcus pyogenes, putative [Babesia ovis]
MSYMASLSAKNLGKIAVDVSRSADSDIYLWQAFIDCCSQKVALFDRKDTLRVWKGLMTFYRNYDYRLRPVDVGFIQDLISHSIEMSNGYTCDELSQLAECVCEFATVNDVLLSSVTPLFSKIGIVFNMRLAEAVPYGVVRLLVSFSRLGIRDPTLLDSLAKFICNSNEFSVYDLRNIITSYALVGHQSPALFEHATDHFFSVPGMGINELAILSFAYTTANYVTPRVRSLFENHLTRDGKCTLDIWGLQHRSVDIPLFCANLDCLGVNIPMELIDLIQIDDLTEDSFFKVVHLLPPKLESQQMVLERYRKFVSNDTISDHIKVLEYTTKSNFELLEMLHLVCKRVIELFTTGANRNTEPPESLNILQEKFLQLLDRVPPALLPNDMDIAPIISQGTPSITTLSHAAMSKTLVDATTTQGKN